MDLRLKVVDGYRHRDSMRDVQIAELTPDERTKIALRIALFGEPNPLTNQHMGLMARMVEMPDPLQALREARVSNEIVRSLAEVVIVDELVGSGRAARVTKFRLGTSVVGQRRLELEWESPRRVGVANESHGQRLSLEGSVQL